MSNELATIQTLFEARKDQLAQLLPKHVSAERLTRIALAAISRNPTLMKCSQASLLASLLDYLVCQPLTKRRGAFLPGMNTEVSNAR